LGTAQKRTHIRRGEDRRAFWIAIQEYEMSQTRVYVAVPLTHSRGKTRAQYICKFLTDAGFKVTSPWVARKDTKQALTPQGVYDRDVLAIAASDAVIAEVSVPSLGIGMELMVALSKGIPIVCLHEKGESVSWMVLGAPGVHIVSYPHGCLDQGMKNVSVWLLTLRLSSIPKKLILHTNREVPECTKES
jgi:hypothetical protein